MLIYDNWTLMNDDDWWLMIDAADADPDAADADANAADADADADAYQMRRWADEHMSEWAHAEADSWCLFIFSNVV